MKPLEIARRQWPHLNFLALIGKRPVEKNWQRWCTDRQPPDHLDRWASSTMSYNVGLPLGQAGFVAIDIDTDESEHVGRIVGSLPSITIAKRGRRGFTALFRDPTGAVTSCRWPAIVEVLARGTQTVIPPSIHPETHRPFFWLDLKSLASLQFKPASGLPDLCSTQTFGPSDLQRLRCVVTQISGKMEIIGKTEPEHVLASVHVTALTEQERRRHLRYAESILACELVTLGAMATNSGRNREAFRLVSRVGRWVHAGILPAGRLAAEVLEACRSNGLVSEDGARAVLATIESGLRKSTSDTLPNLDTPAK